jgi:hypothetical protein
MRTGQTVTRAGHYLQLEALDPLPCGCVAAIFRVGGQGIRLMSVEAKGPYCLTSQHTAGRLVEPADEEIDSIEP